MKICPQCQTRYTDDTLKFCLQDGTPLVSQIEETDAPTVVLGETETVVSPRSFDVPNQSNTGYTTNQSYVEPEEKPKLFKIVAVTVLTMFVLLTAIVAGAWFYLNSGTKEIVQNTNTVKNTKTATKQTTEANKTDTTANNSDNNNSATPTPTPEKTPEINVEKVKKEVSGTISSWKTAAENLNENEYMSFYAAKLDYYNKKGASRDFVRNDKVRALTPYDKVEIKISNLSVAPNADGETATAVFDKQWFFEGDENYSEGKVQSQVKFKRFGNDWKIVGEKDLKVYYVNK